MVQMQLEHEAVMRRHAAAQRRLQLLGGSADAPVGQHCQRLGLGLAGDQGLEHAPAGLAQHIAVDESSLMLASSSVFWMRC